MAYVAGDLITQAEINAFLSTIKSVYGVGSGDRGYGQTTINQNNVSTGNVVNASEWVNLRSMVSTCLNHQAASTSDLMSEPTIGSTITTSNSLATLIEACDTNRLTAHPTSMTLTSAAYTDTRTSLWTTTIDTTFNVDWGNENAARYFFNSGGEIRIRFSHPNGASSLDNAWRTIFTTRIGTISVKARGASMTGDATTSLQNVGFYDISDNSPVALFTGTNIGSGAYSNNDVYITMARRNYAGVNSGNGTGLQFAISIVDQHSGYAWDYATSGTAVIVDVYRATVHLSGIAAPTITNVNNLNT